MSAFSADSITCQRGQQKLFSNLSFSLQAGTALLIQGQNGIGKSSLLRLLAGLATPKSGDILWCGKSIYQDTDYHCALHYIGHANGIKLGLTVQENLSLLSHLANTPMSCDSKVLELLQLHHYQHTFAKQLSAGQRRRIALAKLWLFPKKLWILDEPLTSLDTETQTILANKIDMHLEQGGMAILSSHQPIPVKRGLQTLRLDHVA